MWGSFVLYVWGTFTHQSKGFMSAADTETLFAFEPTRFLVVDDSGILYVSK